MTLQVSQHDLLVLLMLFTSLAMLLLLVVIAYKRHKERKRLNGLKYDIKEDARNILHGYNKRQTVKARESHGRKQVLNELTDDSSNNSVLNINKLLKVNISQESSGSLDRGDASFKRSGTTKTNRSDDDATGRKSFMA